MKVSGQFQVPKWQRQAYKIWFLLPSWYYSNIALVGPEEFQKVHLICSCLLHILPLISLNTQDSVCSLLLCPQKTWCLLVGNCIFFSSPCFPFLIWVMESLVLQSSCLYSLESILGCASNFFLSSKKMALSRYQSISDFRPQEPQGNQNVAKWVQLICSQKLQKNS